MMKTLILPQGNLYFSLLLGEVQRIERKAKKVGMKLENICTVIISRYAKHNKLK